MLVQRWRSSGCHWLIAVAMVTLVGSASSPEIRTAAGTGQGGSALPSHLDTMSQPGITKYDVTAELSKEQFKEKYDY